MTVTGPDLLDVRREGPELRIRARVPKDLVYLEGHFPGHPVLPGFVQLDWVLAWAREHLGTTQAPAAIEALKFRAQVPPETELEFRVEPTEAGLRFRIGSGGGEVSSGRLRLAPSMPRHRPQPEARLETGVDLPLLVPQTGPMRLLERVLASEKGVTLCAARIGDATPLCRAGRVAAWLALELLAQAMAAQGGLAARDAEGPSRAFLVGARRIELRTRGFATGERLWLRAEHLRGETGFVVSECALGTGDPPSDAASARERALAWGPLKAYIEPAATSATSTQR